jgi:hypothetical protein
MDVDVDGNGDDGDDASSSKDPCRCGSMQSVSSPSKSLPEARFHEFLVSLCVGSLFHLHGVRVFDGAKPLTPNIGGDTGGPCPYECP